MSTVVGEGQSQSQRRLRQAGSESRGVALSGCGSRWVVATGRVLPSPGTGGNQSSAGSSTGGSFRGCRISPSPVALPTEPWSGYACQAKGAPDLGGRAGAALRARSATTDRPTAKNPLHTDPKQKITVPSRGEILQRTSGAPRPGLGPARVSRGNFTSSSPAQPPGGPMRNSASEGPSGTARSQPLPLRGNFTSDAHLHEHSLDQRLAGTTGSRSGSWPGNAGGRRSVDQIGGVILAGRSR